MVRLLEREDELGVLAEAVQDAVAGRGSVVLVAGEAGIGKSSLLRELGERTGERVRFLTGACEPLSVPVPLAPLRELVEAGGGGDLIEVGGDDRLVLARRVASVLAERAPVVAVIEDIHWADPLTLDLTRLLVRRVPQLGAVIIATFRDDEAAANPELGLLLGDLIKAPGVRRIDLRPLSAAAVRELSASSGFNTAELVRATGGNPFLVVETVAAGGRLPASVRDAALARAGRLSRTGRAVVDAAAVLGQRFDHALLHAVVGGSADAVEEALARGVLVADGTRLGFRHELMREAIETSISPPRLAELHSRALSALTAQAGTTDNARLAHHAELAGLSREAGRYAALASAEAERVGAPLQARLQAERALRLGDDLANRERYELLIRYSRAANFTSIRYEEAVSGAKEALAVAERLGDPLRTARALGALAWALWSLDRMAEAKQAAERAIAVLERTSDAAGLARALSAHIRIEASAFDPAAAIEAAPRARELAAAAQLPDVKIDIDISIGLAHGHGGHAEAIQTLTDALRDARGEGLTIQAIRSYINLMFIGATLRRHELIDTTIGEAGEFCDEVGARIPRHVLDGYMARSLLDRGRWDQALPALAQSIQIWHSDVPLARAMEGLIAARRGESGAERMLGKAWAEIPTSSEDSRHVSLRSAIVEAAWLRGDRRAAHEHLQAAAASPSTSRSARWGGELALWAARHGLELEAPAGAPEAVKLELDGDWRGAIRAWRELDAPYEASLAALPGDDAAARRALAALHKLGAGAAIRAFTRERAARGARPMRGPRRSTLADPAGLTRREREVLDQLAGGTTNTAIAAALHLSERTVAHHVSAILAKLGAATRRAAIEQARSRGLVSQDGTGADQR
ncbi:MAG: AAA family ATPase [Solirubrobacterales bacterium]|nr:AAA family ATPase [Solirubrobacterales bacterium]